MKPLVSVIIPTYNRGRPFCRTLESLFGQSYPRFEVIIVDQSTKKFPEKDLCLKKIGNKAKHLYSNDQNASVARNTGLKVAQGQIVLFLDDDVICLPELISNHVRAYADKETGAVAGRVLTPGQKDQKNQKNTGQITWWGKFTDGFSSTVPQKVSTVITCNASWQKKVLDKVGGFDENFTGPIREDSDLSLRTIKAGYKIVFEPRAVVIHRRSVSGGFRKSEGRLKWYFGFFKSETYFFLKHRTKILVPLFLLTRWQWFIRCMFGFGREVSWRSLVTPFRGIWEGIKAYENRH